MRLRYKELGEMPFLHCCDRCGKFMQEGHTAMALTYESSDGALLFLFHCLLCHTNHNIEVKA